MLCELLAEFHADPEKMLASRIGLVRGLLSDLCLDRRSEALR
jgi:hypothetical protein